MSVHWSHQSALLVLLTCLLHHFTGGELICGSAIGNYDCNHVDIDHICKDETQPPVCPTVADLSYNTGGTYSEIGCSASSSIHQLARNSTTDAQLSLTPVAHNCWEYNLTVSWTFNTTIPIGSRYELKYFRNGDLIRTICSQQIDWTRSSFDGLEFEWEYVHVLHVVELTVLDANESELLVIKTELTHSPSSYYEILPVSPYRCGLKKEIRTSPVTNLSHTLSLEEGTYRVELTWEPPAPVVQYMIPVTYFVTLFNSLFSTTVHTNQTQMVIYSLEPTREHFIKVEPFVPCSSTCGSSENRTILSAPFTSPNISHIVTLSPTTIEAKWNDIPESDLNGIISQYEVRYKVVNESMLDSIFTRNLSVLLSDLRASTAYEVSVRAYTSVGPGPFCMAVTNQTMDEEVATVDVAIVAGVSTGVVVVAVSFCVVLFITVLVLIRRKTEEVEVTSDNRANLSRLDISKSPSEVTFCCTESPLDKEASLDSSSDYNFPMSHPTHVMATNNPIVEYPSSTTTLPNIEQTSMESLNNIELSPVKPLNSQSSPIRGVSPDSPSVVVLYSPITPTVEIRDILGTLVAGLCQYGINAKSPDTCVSDSISAWLEREVENSIVLLVCNESLKSDWECERPSKLVCSLRQLLHGSLVDRGLSNFATVFMGKDAESGYVPSAYLMPQNQFTVRDINDVIDISHFVFKIPRYEARYDV